MNRRDRVKERKGTRNVPFSRFIVKLIGYPGFIRAEVGNKGERGVERASQSPFQHPLSKAI